MRRPVPVWLLMGSLLLLAVGGFIGAAGFLSDPTGKAMGMDHLLQRLPLRDYTLPGLFLLVVMGLLPLWVVYGLWTRRCVRPLDPLDAWAKHHWAWGAAGVIGVVLVLWLVAQALMIGFAAPIQWFTAVLDAFILATTFAPATRTFYAHA